MVGLVWGLAIWVTGGISGDLLGGYGERSGILFEGVVGGFKRFYFSVSVKIDYPSDLKKQWAFSTVFSTPHSRKIHIFWCFSK